MKVCKVECFYSETKEQPFFLSSEQEEKVQMPDSYEEIKNFVFAKLINTSQNLELLGSIPNKSILDLSLVYYIFKDHDPDEEEILITNEMIRKWNVKSFALFQDAMFNTRNLLGKMVRPLREVINEMLGRICEDICVDEEPEDGLPMYVLTNNWKRNGAVCMLFMDSLKEFAESLESDLYVIPSSIHEVILVPKYAEVNRSALDSIICDINYSELREEDVLSDHTYLYSRKADRIVM